MPNEKAVIPYDANGEVATSQDATGDDMFLGISSTPVTDTQAAILSSPVSPDDIEVRPDGQIYYPEMKYRTLLNKAFGPAGWGMRPMASPIVKDGLVMQTWALYIGGRFISVATGENQLVAENLQMTYGDVLEGAKSVALRRLCKDLGVAAELWDRAFVENFKKTHCVKVWTEKSKKPLWRKLSSEPFYGETACSDDSPNKDKYVKSGNVGTKARKIIEDSRMEGEHDQRTEGEKVQQAMSSPQSQSSGTNTPAPEYVEGILTYRNNGNAKEVNFNGKWFVANNQIPKPLAEKLASLFSNEHEARNHAKKHFAGNAGLSTLTYEEAAAVYEWKKNGKPHPRWYQDKIDDVGKNKSTAQDITERLQKCGLAGNKNPLVAKWAKDLKWPQPYVFDAKVVGLLSEVCALIENGTYKLSSREDVAELDKMVMEAWKS